MSFRAVTWAFDVVRGLGATEKLVLLALAEFANDADETWRSMDEIASRAECSVRSVKTHLASLEAAGLIVRTARYAWCDSDEDPCVSRPAHKHRVGTLYRLNVGAQIAAPKAPSSIGANSAPVANVLESCGKVHRCKNCTCGEEMTSEGSIGANLRSPQVQDCVPHMIIEPPYKPPYLTSPENAVAAGLSRSGQVGLTDDDRSVLAACLPDALQVLDASGAVEVAASLRGRLAAGWRPFEIRQLLDSPLPPKVFRLSALVLRRLEDNVAVGAAPAVLRGLREAEREQRRLGLLREPGSGDDVFTPEEAAFLDDLGRREPGLSQRRRIERLQLWRDARSAS